jgi:hypothetical protein
MGVTFIGNEFVYQYNVINKKMRITLQIILKHNHHKTNIQAMLSTIYFVFHYFSQMLIQVTNPVTYAINRRLGGGCKNCKIICAAIKA